MINTLIHHTEAVLHLRFSNGMMVTCSKVRFNQYSNESGSHVLVYNVGIISVFTG